MRLLLLVLSLAGAALAADELLLYEYSRDGVDKVLAEAVNKGMKRITLVLLPAGEAKANVQGQYAMGYGGQGHKDVGLPNPAFFQHVDWVIKRASSKGLQVAVLPVHSETILLKENSSEKFFEFGRYLGRRYLKAKGLVWLREQDAVDGSLTAIEYGIREFDTLHAFETWKPRQPAASFRQPLFPSSTGKTYSDGARQNSSVTLPASMPH